MSAHRLFAASAAAVLVASCGVAPANPPTEPLAVPMTVSDFYSPDGFWGDGEKRGALVVTRDCPMRDPGSRGDCYTITYTPGAQRFAGINWQHPHNNWGYWPGHRIAEGATRVSLKARGARGGETLSFGGGQSSQETYSDSFSLSAVSVTLTTSWMPVQVPFRGENYQSPSGVLAPFIVSLMAGDSDDPRTFYLDDIRWEK